MKTGFEQISTPWSILRQAHDGQGAVAREAQRILIEKYRHAVYRYLLGAVKNPDQAEELFQEFAFRFVRGDFRNAHPQSGRFRDYLRCSMSHMINDWRRANRKWPAALNQDIAAPQDLEEDPFLQAWRKELINQTWARMKQKSPLQYSALLYRVEHPEASAADAAVDLSAQSGRQITAGNVWVILHRARNRFARLLREEIATTLDSPTKQQVARELKLLNLSSLAREKARRERRAREQ